MCALLHAIIIYHVAIKEGNWMTMSKLHGSGSSEESVEYILWKQISAYADY